MTDRNMLHLLPQLVGEVAPSWPSLYILNMVRNMTGHPEAPNIQIMCLYSLAEIREQFRKCYADYWPLHPQSPAGRVAIILGLEVAYD